MADTSTQDRHLPASARKLQKAREEGQVARSRDLSHVAAIGAGLALLIAFAPAASRLLADTLKHGLRFDARTLAEPDAMLRQLAEAAHALLMVAAPVGLVLALVALGAAVASGGWVWSWKALVPKFERLDPIAGAGRLVSMQQVGVALKSCLLALVLGVVGALYLRSHVEDFGAALGLPLPAAVSHTAGAIAGGLLLLLLALAAFAAVDVPLQRLLHARRLRMSHQEAKQEHKELEGQVEIKAKVRARMREMANRRMLAAVPKADLVVMNPTHYAVALKYDEATMAAPRVVAKGADLMALRIRDLARGAQVPVLQAPPLARALYAHAELDREIPARLFGAVAQVLAHVYQLRAALAGSAPMPGELPTIDVPAELDPHAAA